VSRLRTIKPGFFTNEELGECDPLARLLYAGLWTEADKDGRLEDRPKRLKARLLPYDVCDGDILLQQLADHGFITRYEVGGEKYIAIPQWYAHQKPHPKEASHGYPSPPKRRVLQGSREKVVASNDLGEYEPGCLLSSVLCLEEIETPKEQSSLSPATRVARDTDKRFSEFWSIFPNRQGKKDASRHWRRFTANQHDRAITAASAVAFAVANGYQEAQYVPAASAWLNQERFDDWYDEEGNMVVPPNYAPNGNGKLQAQVDRLSRLASEMDWEGA
jgi:hypothetical protein